MCDEHDATRVKLFCVGQVREKLLRTSDAVQSHIRWAHYQSWVWNQANCSSPILSVVTDLGWKRTDSHLVPHLLSLPAITRTCSEIMSRGFTKGCLSCKTEKLNWIQLYWGDLLPTSKHFDGNRPWQCLSTKKLNEIVMSNFESSI